MGEPGSGDGQPAFSKEHQQSRLNRWVESGMSPSAVAEYGGSVNVLRRILSTGTVPSYTTDNPSRYQQRLLQEGHLYYFTPILERVQPVRPELVQNLVERSPDAAWFLSPDMARKNAAGYALEQAVKDCFQTKTGRRVDPLNIYRVALDIMPEDLDTFLEETEPYQIPMDIEDIRDDADAEIVESLRSSFSPSVLKTAIGESFRRRGVIIHSNQGIFAGNNKVYPGEEGEHEFMVVSKQPLSDTVIAGVDILSEADKEALYL
jgi:hypothetical protein